MKYYVDIVGGGLAGSEAALQLAERGVRVRLYEMRPQTKTPVHTGGDLAELVCSNSLKSMKPESAAGMLKTELKAFNSVLLQIAYDCQVDAGNALAVDRELFSQRVTEKIESHPNIELFRNEVTHLDFDGAAVVLATGPLTSEALAREIISITGSDRLAFYDAAAPIVMADSLDYKKLFTQGRYEGDGEGDYLNAPFNQDQYNRFIEAVIEAKRVIKKEFESGELFQACQPIEEIARKGKDAPRYGAMKPVGLTDPVTGRRPWAAVQLRAEDANRSCYNLVGFQTNLTFSEQKRVFSMIPGLENAEFTRFGVMHRNTFIDAPQVLLPSLQVKTSTALPLFIAGQLGGTEGYCEAIMSGLWAALNVYLQLQGLTLETLPKEMVFGSLLAYATDQSINNYQPMHVNFGIIEPLDTRIRNKQERYSRYASRGREALEDYLKRNSSLFEGMQ